MSRRSRVPGDPSDLQLVSACRAGDSHAWEQLVLRYQRLIYAVPMRSGLSEEDAADIFQETCLRLFAHLHTLHDPSRVDAWLVSTSRRLSLDALSRRRPVQGVEEGAQLSESADLMDQPEEWLAGLEKQQRIRRAVARLDERCRALLYQLFYDPSEPSYVDIAANLGLSKDSVGPIRARCFSRLRALLVEDPE